MPYQLLDAVELIRDLPEQRLRAGMRGAVVDRYGNDEYEVEFVGGNGETLALLALNGKSDFKRGRTGCWHGQARGYLKKQFVFSGSLLQNVAQ